MIKGNMAIFEEYKDKIMRRQIETRLAERINYFKIGRCNR
jgi:hypothetical protein